MTRFTHFKGCFNGAVKLDGVIPMIYWGGKWSPICGHYFWNNDNGVNKFCKALGYDYGQKWKTNQKSQSIGFWIGKCKNKDHFPRCTGGCNKRSHGGSCKTHLLGGPSCDKRKHNLIKVECHGSYGSFSSC